MANTIKNIEDAGTILARGVARMIADELQFCKNIKKVPASEYDGKNGFKAGTTIKRVKPARFIPDENLDFDITGNVKDITEEESSLTLDIAKTVSYEVDSYEMATDIDIANMMERVGKRAASSIAQHVESKMLENATDATYNSVGTAGSNGFTVDDILQAREKLGKYLCPKDSERCLLLDSSGMRNAVDERKGLFHSSSQVEKQYEQGLIGLSDGFKWYENELLNRHTVGNDVTGVAVEADVVTIAEGMSTLGVDGLTATTGTVTKGSVFTIANVNAVHPITKTTYGFVQQFVVTADATANGSGQATLSISPSIYAASAGLQNVDALPVDEAALTFVGTASTAYTQSLAFHKEAFEMVSVPLVLPKKAEIAAQVTEDGITIAYVRDWDQKTRKLIDRFDFLGGIHAPRPEWACRITE